MAGTSHAHIGRGATELCRVESLSELASIKGHLISALFESVQVDAVGKE